MEEEFVLVTGASGFIASHIVQQLQKAGYKVRGTVRSLQNEEKVKLLRNLCPDANYPVELVEAELTNTECWTNAVSNCKYVMHVASPVVLAEPADENELIKPAVEGTLNVLRACQEGKTVERVILTSSVAAVSCGFDVGGDKVYTEEDWTDIKMKDAGAYNKSKTLAEKAAWDFMKNLADDDKFELVVMNPVVVLGPVLSGPITPSMEIPKRLMEKQIPMLAPLNFACIDVRDVAAAHVNGLTNPEAVGKRHILSTSNLWFKDIAEILVKEFKGQGYDIPTMTAPYPLLWLFARFDKSAKRLLTSVGKVTKFNNDRMVSVLGIKPRPLEETLLDMCYSMIEDGKIKKTTGYKGPPIK